MPVLPPLPWKWIGAAVAALIVVSAVFFSIRAYGDARYEAGERETDAEWRAASEAVARASLEAAGVADAEAEVRAAAHAERLSEERKEIADAVASGTDPFDALFPDRVRDDARDSPDPARPR